MNISTVGRSKLRVAIATPLLMGVALLGMAGTALAIDASSNNYQVVESQLGTGGASLDGCSGEYCAQATIGDPGAASSATSVEFGEVETDEPALEVIIEPGESNLGVLSTERTATKVTTVKVRNNFEGGYSLQIVGESPKFGSHVLATPSIPTPSEMGKEQFGINLTKNTIPPVGELPRQVSTVEGEEIIYGEPVADYATPNEFMYINGDVIAQSLLESGRTDFTISMIINISNNTPSGNYTSDFGLYIVPML